jgi:hypothetical protein
VLGPLNADFLRSNPPQIARLNEERANMQNRKPRNYQAEYARRIAKALARGLSKSQARGHAKAAEAALRPPKPISDERLQLALRVLRQESNFAAAARAAKISPERLRKYASEQRIIEKEGRRWRTRADLPRRMLLFTNGKSLATTVGDFETASLVGRFMSAVGHFLETNNRSVLMPFVGQSVRDINGREHPFETRPNVLYRLAAAGEHTFEQIYRIVV